MMPMPKHFAPISTVPCKQKSCHSERLLRKYREALFQDWPVVPCATQPIPHSPASLCWNLRHIYSYFRRKKPTNNKGGFFFLALPSEHWGMVGQLPRNAKAKRSETGITCRSFPPAIKSKHKKNTNKHTKTPTQQTKIREKPVKTRKKGETNRAPKPFISSLPLCPPCHPCERSDVRHVHFFIALLRRVSHV